MGALAIYPGTFDPITFGHMDLVHRALTLFDQVIVGVAESQAKHPMFSLEKRVQMAEKALEKYRPNIQVIAFDSLLADFMKAQQVTVLLRGLRAVSDFEYEFQMAGMNRRLMKSIETVFLMPADQYQFISSTMVREVAGFGGDVSHFVPESVLQEIASMESDQSKV